MMEILGRRARAVAAACALPVWAAVCLPAWAVPVPDIYAESVPLADQSTAATSAAFTEALRRVLVKATGRAAAGQDNSLLDRFGDPAAMVQQYRRDAAGSLWAQFDATLVRRGLAAADMPVWGDDRPLTVVWLAYDSGAGEREVLSSGAVDTATAVALRQEVQDAARSRGVPVVLPLRDSQELAAVAYADVWGDFTAPLTQASARYQADAVLIGRARLFPPGMPDVRWTLLVGGERMEWRGGIADGPQGLAERLSQRMAVSGAGGTVALLLAVDGIRTLDDYGAVLACLQGLYTVESLAVATVAGEAVTFSLRLRGDREQFARALAVRRVIVPVSADTASAQGDSPSIVGPVMNYRMAGPP